MRKSIYTQAVDGIKAPNRAVGKMLETARSFDKKEKIINMKKPETELLPLHSRQFSRSAEYSA